MNTLCPVFRGDPSCTSVPGAPLGASPASPSAVEVTPGDQVSAGLLLLTVWPDLIAVLVPGPRENSDSVCDVFYQHCFLKPPFRFSPRSLLSSSTSVLFIKGHCRTCHLNLVALLSKTGESWGGPTSGKEASCCPHACLFSLLWRNFSFICLTHHLSAFMNLYPTAD